MLGIALNGNFLIKIVMIEKLNTKYDCGGADCSCNVATLYTQAQGAITLRLCGAAPAPEFVSTIYGASKSFIQFFLAKAYIYSCVDHP